MIAKDGWARRWWRVAYVTLEFLTLVGLLFGVPAAIYVFAGIFDIPVR